MPKLKFLATFIRSYDGRISKDDQDVVRIHLTSALTSRIAERLGCDDALRLDSVTAAPVNLAIPEILITDVRLEVESLEKHALEIPGQKLSDFAAVRLDNDGAITRELRFRLTAGGAVAPSVREYWSKIGTAPGLLTVSTQEQESLPEDPAEKQQELPAA